MRAGWSGGKSLVWACGVLLLTSLSWVAPASSAAGDGVESLCGTTAYPAFSVGVDTALGPDGNVWFTDLVTLGKVTPSGRYTIYSRGFSEVNYLGGITAGPDGNMWFTEQMPVGKVGKVTTDGQITEYTAGITPDSRPADITAGPDGNLWYVAIAGNKVVRVTTDGVVTEFAIPVPNVSAGAIAAGPDGNLWFTGASGVIGRVTTSGEFTMFTEGLSSDSVPTGIAVGADGNLWFADFAGRIGRITPSGVITEFVVPPMPPPEDGSPAPQQAISAIAATSDGSLWFNERFTGRVGRITTDGDISIVATLTTTLDLGGVVQVTLPLQPRALTAGSDGNVWMFAGTSEGMPAIGRLTPSGDFAAYVTGVVDRFPIGRDVAADGKFWYGGLAAGVVGYLTPEGDANAWLVSGALTLAHIGGLAIGPDGDLWYTESEGARVVRMHPDGTIVARFSQGISAGSSPSTITRGPDGNMWFAEPGTKSVARITPTGTVTEFSAGITGTPALIVAAGDDLWFTEMDGDGVSRTIGRVTTDGVVTEFDEVVGAGSTIGGITGGPDGTVWFTDVVGDRIGRMAPSGAVTWFGDGIPAGSVPYDITVSGGDLWFGMLADGVVGRMTTDGDVTLFDAVAPNLPDPSSPQEAAANWLNGDADGNLWLNSLVLPVRHATAPDAVGDRCNHDEDSDTVSDFRDNCPTDPNGDQADLDGDLIGNACDPDDDNDATADTADNCPVLANADQADADEDGIGDACDRGVVLRAGSGSDRLSVRLTDSGGQPVGGALITFTNRAHKNVCTAVTTSQGWARCPWGPSVSSLHGGYRATFAGDELHDPATVTVGAVPRARRQISGWAYGRTMTVRPGRVIIDKVRVHPYRGRVTLLRAKRAGGPYAAVRSFHIRADHTATIRIPARAGFYKVSVPARGSFLGARSPAKKVRLRF